MLLHVISYVVLCLVSTEHVHVFLDAMVVVSPSAVLAVVIKVFGEDWHPAFIVKPMLLTHFLPTIPLLAEAPFWSGRWSGPPVLVFISHKVCSGVGKTLTIDLGNSCRIINNENYGNYGN